MIQGIEQINALAKAAGTKILDIYNSDFSVTYKGDESPLTQADLLAHEVICGGLQLLAPDIPVLSEESTEQQIQNRLCWSRYWLVDPLDGTKEFVSRNGEFTVNIALIDNGVPIFGVVYAPVLDLIYWGSDAGAFKQQGSAAPQQVFVAQTPALVDKWRVVASRSHLNSATKQYLTQFAQTEVQNMGSSLKFCLVAEGAADIYPRMAPTSEWDSAAAQAVVEAAGGCVLEYPNLQPLRYNRRNSLLNPNFIVCAETPLIWT
ncbi:MAG: 3'(2'),5'-bisphosphate nucleotidase CysQ [Pseudomonadales bacterium]|nr:3'(2'),5'-bisphosphate nucleotidase CysQ [Pseudomonadales bacterium]NRA16077.1 3'(2'),5'-bisphosphate nucleotidase CysQ [Oceanospirillaceae bacterium]